MLSAGHDLALRPDVAISERKCWALGLLRRVGSRTTARSLWSRELEAACRATEQPGFGVRCGERLQFGYGVAYRQYQSTGSYVQYETDPVGQHGPAIDAVGDELGLMRLDQVFSLAARATQRVIRMSAVL